MTTPSRDEINKAIQIANEFIIYKGADLEVDEAIKTLSKFASRALTAKMPERKFVNEANKSPKPDILNDREVRREGFNDCLDLCRPLIVQKDMEIAELKDELERRQGSNGPVYLHR